MHVLSGVTSFIPRLRHGAILLACVVVVGCAEIIPDMGLRDDYMGKALLQPDKVPRPVVRDETGDADLKKRREINIPYLPQIRF